VGAVVTDLRTTAKGIIFNFLGALIGLISVTGIDLWLRAEVGVYGFVAYIAIFIGLTLKSNNDYFGALIGIATSERHIQGDNDKINVYLQEMDLLKKENPENSDLHKLIDAYKVTWNEIPSGPDLPNKAIMGAQTLLTPAQQQTQLAPSVAVTADIHTAMPKKKASRKALRFFPNQRIALIFFPCLISDGFGRTAFGVKFSSQKVRKSPGECSQRVLW